MEQKQIDGVTIRLGGNDYVVPPLSFKQVKKLLPRLQLLAKMDPISATPEQRTLVVELVQSALSRNYPEVTMEEVEDMLDLGNMLGVLKAVTGISGLIPTGENKVVSR